MSRNERLATGLPVGGTFTGSFRSDARELASISCMVSRQLRIGTLSRPRDTQTSIAFPMFFMRTNRKRFGGFKGRDANNFRQNGTLTFRRLRDESSVCGGKRAVAGFRAECEHLAPWVLPIRWLEVTYRSKSTEPIFVRTGCDSDTSNQMTFKSTRRGRAITLCARINEALERFQDPGARKRHTLVDERKSDFPNPQIEYPPGRHSRSANGRREP